MHVNEIRTKSIVNTHVLKSVQLLGSFDSATEDVVMMQFVVLSISLSLSSLLVKRFHLPWKTKWNNCPKSLEFHLHKYSM